MQVSIVQCLGLLMQNVQWRTSFAHRLLFYCCLLSILNQNPSFWLVPFIIHCFSSPCSLTKVKISPWFYLLFSSSLTDFCLFFTLWKFELSFLIRYSWEFWNPARNFSHNFEAYDFCSFSRTVFEQGSISVPIFSIYWSVLSSFTHVHIPKIEILLHLSNC